MKKPNIDWTTIAILAALAFLLIGVPIICALGPLFEARAFNRLTTGPKATYWDALWSDLRVMTK